MIIVIHCYKCKTEIKMNVTPFNRKGQESFRVKLVDRGDEHWFKLRQEAIKEYELLRKRGLSG